MTLIIAAALGVAFGFALERGGMGSAPKLAAQFYLRDFTVIKVMFSALVTAMLGSFWLARIGVLDLSHVYVPETFLLSQAVGGVVFGIGFVLGGLCPGTSCVAAATGRIDGFAAVAGMFAGVAAFGFAMPLVQTLYQATPRGALTLPKLSGMPYGLWVAVIALGAVAMFAAIPRVERWAAHRASPATGEAR